MAAAVFAADRGPRPVAIAASSVSTAFSRYGLVINVVRQTIVATSRLLITPSRNSAATFGSRSRSAVARYICDDAIPWLICSAAPTSEAAASQ
nr:hypothetical protein [Mycolicibacter virginiensis]